jgi:hypothetical protein
MATGIHVQDLVVGYMGVPKSEGVPMTRHPQYVTVRYELPTKPDVRNGFKSA